MKETRLYSHATLTSREQLLRLRKKAVLTCHLYQQRTAAEWKKQGCNHMPPWPAENSYSVKERRLYSHATLTSREQLQCQRKKAVLTCHPDQQRTATVSKKEGCTHMPPWPAENSYSVKERRLYSHATLTSREQLLSETNKAVLTCHLDQQRTLNKRNKAYSHATLTTISALLCPVAHWAWLANGWTSMLWSAQHKGHSDDLHAHELVTASHKILLHFDYGS